jgi:hypothetical protein
MVGCEALLSLSHQASTIVDILSQSCQYGAVLNANQKWRVERKVIEDRD